MFSDPIENTIKQITNSSGKDQCDRDSATAKRQMNYYVNQGHNITTACEMNEALQHATALCGFNTNVMDIEKGEKGKKRSIPNITQLHHFKYYKDDGKMMCRVWRYYKIGEGKVCVLPHCPVAPPYSVIIPFRDNITSLGQGKRNPSANLTVVYCTDEMCVKSMKSCEELQYHLDFEQHEYCKKDATQLLKVKDRWVEMFQVERVTHHQQQPVPSTSNEDHYYPILPMGWAIKPNRVFRRYTEKQKKFLQNLFDDGERTHKKCTAKKALEQMRNEFETIELLPETSIASFFTRRNASKAKDQAQDAPIHEAEADEEAVDDDSGSEDEVQDELVDNALSNNVAVDILHQLNIVSIHRN